MSEPSTASEGILKSAPSSLPVGHLAESGLKVRSNSFAVSWQGALEGLLKPHVLLLTLVALFVVGGITRGELHFYNDEMRHAFNGVFFRDFLVDLPLRHPLQYAYQYYAKYPAIAIPHWPPLFHMIEGLFFLLLGISVWVSRLVLLLFALMATYFWYRIAERQGSRYRAFLAALLFASAPYVLLYEKVTMLEIPVMALCLGAIFYWLRLLEEGRSQDVWAVAGFSVAALLTGQAAIFLPFFFALHLLVERRFRLLGRWDVWAAVGAAVAVVLPWYLLAARTLSVMGLRVIGKRFEYLTRPFHYMFYLQNLPRQLGWILVCLAAVGVISALLTARGRYRFLLLWILSSYICFTLIREKDLRHTMIWLPPMVYFALLGLDTLLFKSRWAQVATTGLVLFFLIQAFRFERPQVTGVGEVARFVVSLPESDVVYYQGDLNGDFVFFVRKFDPEKRHLVAREKQVVVGQIAGPTKPVLRHRGEILDFFRTWGIRYAVVESVDPVPGLGPVRAVLHSDEFELLRTFSLETNDPHLRGRFIEVYRYRGPIERSSTPVQIPMLTIRDDVKADLNRLAGRPWPN